MGIIDFIKDFFSFRLITIEDGKGVRIRRNAFFLHLENFDSYGDRFLLEKNRKGWFRSIPFFPKSTADSQVVFEDLVKELSSLGETRLINMFHPESYHDEKELIDEFILTPCNGLRYKVSIFSGKIIRSDYMREFYFTNPFIEVELISTAVSLKTLAYFIQQIHFLYLILIDAWTREIKIQYTYFNLNIYGSILVMGCKLRKRFIEIFDDGGVEYKLVKFKREPSVEKMGLYWKELEIQ